MNINVGKNGTVVRLNKSEVRKLQAAQELASLIASHAAPGVAAEANKTEQAIAQLVDFFLEADDVQTKRVIKSATAGS